MLILYSKIINEIHLSIKLSQACHTTKLKKNVHYSAPQQETWKTAAQPASSFKLHSQFVKWWSPKEL